MEGDRESHVRLHVRRMFITDKAELLPPWLRFVQGVVDTEDLPLNVSREMLQATPVLARIRKALIGRVLSRAEDPRARRPKTTRSSGRISAPVLKEGIWEDAEHRAEIAPLLRFRSSHAGRAGPRWPTTSARMKAGQETIYYLAGDDADGAEILAAARRVPRQGHRGAAADRPDRRVLAGAAGQRSRARSCAASPRRRTISARTPTLPDISPLLAALKAALGDDVSDVRATARLTDSAVVLAAADKGPDLQMQRLMRRAGRAMMPAAPVLEVNPRHRLIAALVGASWTTRTLIAEAAATLLDLARVQEGDLPTRPGRASPGG